MNPADSHSRASLDGPTTAFHRGLDLASLHPPSRCRVRFGQSGSQFLGEVEVLLRARLRLVSLIMLLPAGFFLVKNLLEYDRDPSVGADGLTFQAVFAVTILVMAGLVWLRPCLSLGKLRVVELVLFGMAAALFSWMQYTSFHSNTLYGLAGDGPQELMVVRLLTAASCLRWFILIVLYGVFIPNTGRRCASVVSVMAVMPLVLSATAAYQKGRLDYELLSALSDMAVLLLLATVIAVFGSYRLRLLQRQAYEAQQLGQYRLRRKLGAGGMGEVYLAEHLLLRRPCALKLIRPEQAGDPTNLLRFEREVRAMATLTHWNTVEVYDFGHADDGTFYYVMEYLPGQNLESLVARYGPLPAGRVVYLLRQVCRALREAHSIGLLHRDVKPSNIIACERGGSFDVVKLLDFGLVQDVGLASDADRLTVQGAILGSPPFMSPEQAAGRATLDARSDIYGVGGVAYFLLSGRPPFQKETPLEMLVAHAYEAPAPLRNTPADLAAVVLRCLSKKPEDRFPDADSLERALANCAAADEWTEAQAAAWWRGPGRDGSDTAALDHAPTRVSVPG